MPGLSEQAGPAPSSSAGGLSNSATPRTPGPSTGLSVTSTAGISGGTAGHQGSGLSTKLPSKSASGRGTNGRGRSVSTVSGGKSSGRGK